MRIAALYDIHGNLPALEAVLEEIDALRVDLIVCGGDVLPGPFPCETLARLRAPGVPARFIHGNGDRAVLDEIRGRALQAMPESAREVIRWSAAQLRAADAAGDGGGYAAMIADWPPTLRLDLAGIGDVLFCHATPRNDTELFTQLTREEKLRPVFDPAGAALAICGHTHMQFDRMVGCTRVINAGSIGMPFGAPGADWLMLEGGQPRLRHTEYDLPTAAARVRASGYPWAEEFAAREILSPRGRDEILELYARAELG